MVQSYWLRRWTPCALWRPTTCLQPEVCSSLVWGNCGTSDIRATGLVKDAARHKSATLHYLAGQLSGLMGGQSMGVHNNTHGRSSGGGWISS